MTKKIFVCILSVFVNTALYVQVHAQTSAVQEVINAEKAFAKSAFYQNMQLAFIANMNDSSLLLFQGKLVQGLPLFRQMQPDTIGKLSWTPLFATISAAGDLGYTTGPYHYDVKGQAVAFGDYATVWQKQADGQWKFVIDLGNAHPKPLKVSAEEHFIMPETALSKQGNLPDMLAADSLLCTAANEVLHPAVHVLHDGKEVAIGTDVQTAFTQESCKWQFRRTSYKLATSKDLGVVYGYCETKDNASKKQGAYMHVWRLNRSGRWQLLHETIKLIEQ